MVGEGYDWQPDLPDPRDRVLPEPTVTVPDESDLQAFMPPVYDATGKCSSSAAAVVAMLSFETRRGGQAVALSAPFLWYFERLLDSNVDPMCPSKLRNACKAANGYGAPPADAIGPMMDPKARPPRRAIELAAARKATSYTRIITLDAAFGCLADGHPFAIGLSVFPGMEFEAVARRGERLDPPSPDADLLGGHVVTIVGYRHKGEVFIARNCCGPDWGDHGHFLLSYAYAQDRSLSDDLWTLRA